jgi:hypothetical protein
MHTLAHAIKINETIKLLRVTGECPHATEEAPPSTDIVCAVMNLDSGEAR